MANWLHITIFLLILVDSAAESRCPVEGSCPASYGKPVTIPIVHSAKSRLLPSISAIVCSNNPAIHAFKPLLILHKRYEAALRETIKQLDHDCGRDRQNPKCVEERDTAMALHAFDGSVSNRIALKQVNPITPLKCPLTSTSFSLITATLGGMYRIKGLTNVALFPILPLCSRCP